ncbi:hypothetical protein N474_21045 [Pseudoalteromonas luteoviolacea CPMOR-2]|uniref:Uncharacterized protein n=1 Tax=Pseudoalteromonas luteoviolacea DSM 6061 TaxID=1365250 RepID=A0A166WX72_9GAMM|nr:hypothetical protein N475_15360 [Pseudoalteromonas luteoviolacea DSM 6061]KZN53549.1 hypothetical protein N474_21045 [Pseudoalteromonas luteoviolacea CPMOR-2]
MRLLDLILIVWLIVLTLYALNPSFRALVELWL